MLNEQAFIGLIGVCFAVIGFLIKHAMDRNTDELKGLRGDVGRLFEREEKSGREIVAVQGEIRTINERCRLNHPGA